MTDGRAAGRPDGRRAPRFRRAWAATVAALALLAVWPSGRGAVLQAQTDRRLADALRLAQEGLGDSARATVGRVLTATPPTDPLYAQALYTRALVAADPREMRTDLQRVAVEYAYSEWADDALLRLALVEYAGGHHDAAARSLERIRLDHPSTPLYPMAAYWAGKTYLELHQPADACRWLREGRERAGTDVELRNQIEYYYQRCPAEVADGRAGRPESRTDSVAAPSPDTAGPIAANDASANPAAPPVADTAARPTVCPSDRPSLCPPARRPAFRIQIAAVNTRAAADSIARRAQGAGAGVDAVVVEEPPFHKVRVGAYASRADAEAALPGIRARFGGRPFIVAERE
ncbi:MAG TPA: SPOR domain-containing protein [Gemmatimonadales bacterium]|nr:SPOR domain-containing protein [Gemmatimonadales bacterium]